MRYFFLEPLPTTLSITTLAFGVGMTTPTGRGVPAGGATIGFPSCFPGAAIEAIAVAAIATAADDHPAYLKPSNVRRAVVTEGRTLRAEVRGK